MDWDIMWKETHLCKRQSDGSSYQAEVSCCFCRLDSTYRLSLITNSTVWCASPGLRMVWNTIYISKRMWIYHQCISGRLKNPFDNYICQWNDRTTRDGLMWNNKSVTLWIVRAAGVKSPNWYMYWMIGSSCIYWYVAFFLAPVVECLLSALNACNKMWSQYFIKHNYIHCTINGNSALT